MTLDEVFPREVILLNKRSTPPQRERLRMDEEKEGEDAAAAPGPAPAPAPEAVAEPSERITLKRDEMIQEIASNYASLVTNIRPELVEDENGNVLGITASGIGELPLAQRLGVQENDVLQTVNNEKLDSEDKIMEMVQKYQTATSLRIGILRDGKPKVITYRLE